MVKESGNTAVSDAAVAVMDKNSELQKRIWKVQQDVAELDEKLALSQAREEGKQEIIDKLKSSGLSQEEIDKLLS